MMSWRIRRMEIAARHEVCQGSNSEVSNGVQQSTTRLDVCARIQVSLCLRDDVAHSQPLRRSQQQSLTRTFPRGHHHVRMSLLMNALHLTSVYIYVVWLLLMIMLRSSAPHVVLELLTSTSSAPVRW